MQKKKDYGNWHENKNCSSNLRKYFQNPPLVKKIGRVLNNHVKAYMFEASVSFFKDLMRRETRRLPEKGKQPSLFFIPPCLSKKKRKLRKEAVVKFFNIPFIPGWLASAFFPPKKNSQQPALLQGIYWTKFLVLSPC